MSLETSNPKAVAYIRVSTIEQAQSGLSLENQENRIISYCKDRGYDLEKVYSDELSAKTTKRPGLAAARMYCKRNKHFISKFIVYNLSRLARNLENQILLMNEFRLYGIELESTAENLDNSPVGRAIAQIIGSINELENANKTQLVLENMLLGRENGRPMNMLPVGYLNRRDEKDQPYGIVDPERGHFITEIFQRMLSGAYTQKQLLNYMNRIGFTSKQGKPLTPQTLNRMLRNRTYTGMIFVSADIGWRKSNFIPALVDSETFDEVQLLLEKRKRVYKSSTRTKRSEEFPLTVFAKCECGGSLTGSYSKSKLGTRYPYYRCRSSKCNRNIPKDEIETNFMSLLKTLSPSKELLRAFKLVIKDVYNIKLEDSNTQLKILERKLERVKQRKNTLLDKMLDGIVSSEDYNEKNDALTTEMTDLSINVSEMRTTILELDTVIESAFSALQNIDRTWLNSNTENRRLIQNVVFPCGLVYTNSGEFRTPQVSMAFNILELFEMDESHVVPPPGFEPRLPAPEADALSS